MIKVEQLNITVSVEGDAAAGERAFARLFDKYSRLQAEKQAQEQRQSGHMAQARSLSPDGRR
jgi:hypothetical protein